MMDFKKATIYNLHLRSPFDLIVPQRTSGLPSKVARVAKCFSTAVDNIVHITRVTTSTESFHGSGISLIQHPSYTGEGVNRSIVIAGESGDAWSKTVAPLQLYYTDVPPLQTASQVLMKSHWLEETSNRRLIKNTNG